MNLKLPKSSFALHLPSRLEKIKGYFMRTTTSSRAENLPIVELSKQSGVNIETIRYYERVKMLAPPRALDEARSRLLPRGREAGRSAGPIIHESRTDH